MYANIWIVFFLLFTTDVRHRRCSRCILDDILQASIHFVAGFVQLCGRHVRSVGGRPDCRHRRLRRMLRRMARAENPNFMCKYNHSFIKINTIIVQYNFLKKTFFFGKRSKNKDIFFYFFFISFDLCLRHVYFIYVHIIK